MPPEKVKSFGEDTPLGRPGQPRELAGIFVLLASDEGSYVTGGIHAVTGARRCFRPQRATYSAERTSSLPSS
jgi:NAD(P)-dependent dehydrogenase (short-subunit alcohol dehydrogenase family)